MGKSPQKIIYQRFRTQLSVKNHTLELNPPNERKDLGCLQRNM